MAVIGSMADFGFGRGGMLKSFIEGFQPSRAYGLEPSKVAFSQVSQSELETKGVTVKIEQIGLRLLKPKVILMRT